MSTYRNTTTAAARRFAWESMDTTRGKLSLAEIESLAEHFFSFDNAKTAKGESLGYLTAVHYMMPHTGGIGNVCPFASRLCASACLSTAGRLAFSPAQTAQARRRSAWDRDRDGFLAAAVIAIHKAIGKANRAGLRLAVRLNGTSDIPFESIRIDARELPEAFRSFRIAGRTLPEIFATVQFYDYTKNPNRMGRGPVNYHLTFSRSEDNSGSAFALASHGFNVAVVFSTPRGKALPGQYQGFPVIDGDRHDLRFMDGTGVIVGLRAKGRARRDSSGFVVTV